MTRCPSNNQGVEARGGGGWISTTGLKGITGTLLVLGLKKPIKFSKHFQVLCLQLAEITENYYGLPSPKFTKYLPLGVTRAYIA